MSLSINSINNTISRHIDQSQKEINVAMERLASGKRINSAMDDAAGLAISNKMTAEITGLTQAIKNANDGIAVIQTADGAIESLTDILVRIKELSIQSLNDTYSQQDRLGIASEAIQLFIEFERITDTTSFNDKYLFDGSIENINIQLGTDTNNQLELEFGDLWGNVFGNDFDPKALVDLDIVIESDVIAEVDNGIALLNEFRSDYGAQGNRLEHTISNLYSSIENLSAARSRIMDTDYAIEVVRLSKNQILQQAATAMLAQANSSHQDVALLLR